MTDEFRAELHQVFEEEILVHLRAISASLDKMLEQTTRYNERMEARLAAILAENAAYQAEQKAELESGHDSSIEDTLPQKPLIQ